MEIARLENIVDHSFGGKAYGLALLNRNGFLVPETFCIKPFPPATMVDDISREELEAVIGEKESYHFAVRSSSLIEDTDSESKAGHFLTIIDSFNMDGLINAIMQVLRSGEKMGVILQEAIDADISGVFFSSNPITFSKKDGVLSYVHGMGDHLVSGACAGTDVEVHFDTYNDLQFQKMTYQIKSLEKKLGYPIDVEWCRKDDCFYYLQCRPITSITSVKSGLYKVDTKQVLPNQIAVHDKIQLRYEAAKPGIFVSDAYVHIDNKALRDGTKIRCEAERKIDIIPSKHCKGYSAVVVYPQRISNKVVRSFVGSQIGQIQSDSQCCRCNVCSYPEYKNTQECLRAFHEKTTENYWISAVIIQEIFDAAYTGVVQRFGKGFIIEITKGHFLTKGSVSTTQYYVEDNHVLTRREVYQKNWYRIVQGCVIACESDDKDSTLVTLTDDQVNRIVRTFSAFMQSNNRIVEFGLVYDRDDLLPYLIDFADSENRTNLLVSDIEEGIISRGKRHGIVRRIENTKNTFDKHFHDKIISKEKLSEEIIFLCQRPDISLLDLISKYDNDKISFAFAEGSTLCHLSVVLREKGIPAIRIGKLDGMEEGRYLLDAETGGIRGKERLKHE